MYPYESPYGMGLRETCVIGQISGDHLGITFWLLCGPRVAVWAGLLECGVKC